MSLYERHFSEPRRERAFLSAVGFTTAFASARGITHAIRAGALTLDEFALWLDLQDDYWDKQGRKSIDAVAIFGGLLTIGVAGRGALNELGLLPKALERWV